LVLLGLLVFAVGQTLYVGGGGYYTVSSITNGTTVVLTNLGYAGNAAPAAAVASAAAVTPAGIKGDTGASGAATGFQIGENNNDEDLHDNDYMGPWANKADAAEVKVQGLIGGATGATSTLVSFRARVATAPGTGGKLGVWTFTVRKNGVATSQTCTISGLSTQCVDSAQTVSVAAGDLLSVHIAKVKVGRDDPANTRGAFVTWTVTSP
jgi:uncharacterized protein (UPF0333 family)